MKAHLSRDEIKNARSLGLNVHPHGKGHAFYQPCQYLEHTACSLYEDPKRPHVCGKFRCKLLKSLLAGDVELDSALETVRSTRNLLADLQASAPFGRDQRVTFNGIRLMTAYLSGLSEEERSPYRDYLDRVSEYVHLIAREFIELKELKKDEIAETEMETP